MGDEMFEDKVIPWIGSSKLSDQNYPTVSNYFFIE